MYIVSTLAPESSTLYGLEPWSPPLTCFLFLQHVVLIFIFVLGQLIVDGLHAAQAVAHHADDDGGQAKHQQEQPAGRLPDALGTQGDMSVLLPHVRHHHIISPR